VGLYRVFKSNKKLIKETNAILKTKLNEIEIYDLNDSMIDVIKILDMDSD